MSWGTKRRGKKEKEGRGGKRGEGREGREREKDRNVFSETRLY